MILMAIEYLFAGSIVNGGPGPCFLAPWGYHYIIDGLDCISSFFHRVLMAELLSTAYEVRINLRNIIGKFLLNILYYNHFLLFYSYSILVFSCI